MKKRQIAALLLGITYPLIPFASASAAVETQNTFYDMIKSKVNPDSSQINFSAYASDTNGNGVNKYTENSKDIYYYRGEVDDNNVIWADMCWKIVRTTSTGGTKMIYSGKPNNGKCEATGLDAAIVHNGSKQFKFNNNSDSPADVGYMYGDRLVMSNMEFNEGTVFANDVEYDATTGMYNLSDKYTMNSPWSSVYREIAQGYHYTCGSNAITCSHVYYLTDLTNTKATVLTLNDIENIERAKELMFANINDSNAKKTIEEWFEASGLTAHEDDLEDAIYCDDRSYYNGTLKSKDSTNEEFSASSIYSVHSAHARELYKKNPSLDCGSKRDSFTKTETSTTNGKLKHKIGLITSDERRLAGGLTDADDGYYIIPSNSVDTIWLASPSTSSMGGTISAVRGHYGVTNERSLRPLVSLKAGAYYNAGDGTAQNPYVYAGILQASTTAGDEEEDDDSTKPTNSVVSVKNPDTSDFSGIAAVSTGAFLIGLFAILKLHAKRR